MDEIMPFVPSTFRPFAFNMTLRSIYHLAQAEVYARKQFCADLEVYRRMNLCPPCLREAAGNVGRKSGESTVEYRQRNTKTNDKWTIEN